MSSDRIEKDILLAAPLQRVWHAVCNARQFGSWFGASFDGPFVEGARLEAKIVPTTVDEEVAKLQKPHEGKAFEFRVERVEPMRRICFRWHPFAIDPGLDYSKEPMTLITFELQEVPGGTRLKLTESGFAGIPAERRAQAYAANDGGWAKQMLLVERYLATRTA